jgi:hypothetical protein
LTSHPQNKTPLEAIQLLLLAAGYLSRFPLLSALLTEKAAQYYLLARQYRKFSLHIVLAGHKFNSCGTTSAIDHSSICFAAAMILYDTTEWSTVKSKLWRALADRLKVVHSPNGPRIALLLLLQILSAVTSKNKKSFNGATALNDAVKVYNELIHDKSWGHLTIPEGWESINTRDILLDKTAFFEHPQDEVSPSPFRSLDPENVINLINSPSIDLEEAVATSPSEKNSGITIIEDLRLPEIFMESVVLMTPLNGSSSVLAHGVDNPLSPQIELLKSFLEIEKNMERFPSGHAVSGAANGGHRSPFEYSSLLEICADKLVLADSNIREGGNGNSTFRLGGLSGGGTSTASVLMIPLGEKVILSLQFYNPLPVDLSLRDVQVLMNLPDSFDVIGTELIIPSGTMKEVRLYATPLSLGTYQVDRACWFLGGSVSSALSSPPPPRVQIIQQIRKQGLLLQKTLTQRAHHQRAPDNTLTFNVIETCPLLRLDIAKDIENMEILNGEILRTTLSLYNEGGAAAKNIEFICNYPIGAMELFRVPLSGVDLSNLNYDSETTKSVDFFPFIGQSCTAIRLPNEIVIRPGESIQLRIWFRFHDLGKLQISLLSSYQSAQSDRLAPRNSFTSFQVSLDLS